MHAHNDWLQVLFETGRIGFGVMVSIFMFLFYKLLKAKKWRLLVGMIIISLDMCVHFPTREIQCVFIMIAFLAFCEKEIKYG